MTFEVDLGVAERLAGRLGVRGRVAESGITGLADVARMAAAGYDAVLVGESLVRHGDPAAAVSLLTGQEVPAAGRSERPAGDLGQGMRVTDRRIAEVAAEAGADAIGLVLASSPGP